MKKTKNYEWYVYWDDSNRNQIAKRNILAYWGDKLNVMKKKVKSKEEFEEWLGREMRYLYWAKCEHELLIVKEDERYFLEPWVGASRKQYNLEITNDELICWPSFYEELAYQRYARDGRVKFDVFDQLKFRWDEFVEECWSE